MADSFMKQGGAVCRDRLNNSVFWYGGNHLVGSYNLMAVARTSNTGTFWVRYDLTATTGKTRALAVDPVSSNTVYAGGCEGAAARVYKTTNNGTSWINVTAGIAGDTVVDIEIDPAASNVVYAANGSGVFKSTNSGTGWTNTGLSLVRALVVDPDSPNIVYAGTASGVYKSTAGGGAWSAMNDNLGNLDITALSIYRNNYLYAGTNGSSVYRWYLPVSIAEASSSHCREPLIVVYRNPSHGRIGIELNLARTQHVDVVVCDAQGRTIRQIASGTMSAGKHDLGWNGCDDKRRKVAAGIYFIECRAGKSTGVEKVVYVR